MRKRRLITMLAVVAMMMGAMAPAWAATGGVTSADLEAKGWNCQLDNYPDGAGVHCSRVWVGDFIGGGTGTLHLMVFSSPADTRYELGTFLGTELLRFSSKNIDGKPCGKNTTWHDLLDDGSLFACHAWHGGLNPTA